MVIKDHMLSNKLDEATVEVDKSLPKAARSASGNGDRRPPTIQ